MTVWLLAFLAPLPGTVETPRILIRRGFLGVKAATFSVRDEMAASKQVQPSWSKELDAERRLLK